MIALHVVPSPHELVAQLPAVAAGFPSEEQLLRFVAPDFPGITVTPAQMAASFDDEEALQHAATILARLDRLVPNDA